MFRVCIGLGSNLGDGKKNLQAAWQLLGRIPGISLGLISRPFDSKPLDMESKQRFTNAVGLLETELSPHDLLAVLLGVEQKMGRDRTKGKDRTVDLDLLLFGDQILNEPSLTVPHPELQNRLFVLAPIAEVAPELIHPRLKKSMSRLRRDFQSKEQDIYPMEWHEGESRI